MSTEFDVYRYCETLRLSHRISDQLIGWTGRWSLMGGFVICTQCLATQQVDMANHAFVRLPGCVATRHRGHSWHELSAVLNQLSPLTKG